MFSLQKLTPISTQENFPQKENFVKRDLPTQLPSEKNFEVKNFQHLTMIFSENFQSLEIFLERKWAFTFKDVRCETRIHIKSFKRSLAKNISLDELSNSTPCRV
jgi:hypothetical protein